MFKLDKLIRRILAAVPMVLMLMVIFGFSAGTGEESGHLSLMIAQWLSEMLEKIGVDLTPEILHLPIRKIAHMTEYAVLAITVMWAFYGFKKRYVIALMLSIVYAMTDEVHQLFVDGRAGSAIDVCIDSLGVGIGLIFYKCVASFIKYQSKR